MGRLPFNVGLIFIFKGLLLIGVVVFWSFLDL